MTTTREWVVDNKLDECWPVFLTLKMQAKMVLR